MIVVDTQLLIAVYNIIKLSVPVHKYVLYMLHDKGVGERERGEWFQTWANAHQ